MRPPGATAVVLVLLADAGCAGCHKPAPPVARPTSAEQDRGAALQALLESAWIQNAIEPEAAAVPLVLVTSEPLTGAPLHAFGQSVRVLSPAEAQAQRPEAYLEIIALRLEGDQAQVSFRDDARGVSGEGQLSREREGWRVVRVTGSER